MMAGVGCSLILANILFLVTVRKTRWLKKWTQPRKSIPDEKVFTRTLVGWRVSFKLLAKNKLIW